MKPPVIPLIWLHQNNCEVLFDKLKNWRSQTKETKTGQYATGEEVLSYLANDNPIVRYFELAPTNQTANTYVTLYQTK
jgi:DNA polymerase-1